MQSGLKCLVPAASYQYGGEQFFAATAAGADDTGRTVFGVGFVLGVLKEESEVAGAAAAAGSATDDAGLDAAAAAMTGTVAIDGIDEARGAFALGSGPVAAVLL